MVVRWWLGKGEVRRAGAGEVAAAGEVQGRGGGRWRGGGRGEVAAGDGAAVGKVAVGVLGPIAHSGLPLKVF
jgi:hypothetical protein